MKLSFTTVITLFLFSLNTTAQTFQAEDLIGTWLKSDGSGHIHICKNSDKYFAKSTSAVDIEADKTKMDVNNPDPSKQNILLTEVFILESFKYDGDGEWGGGKIYDPANGKTYKCIIEMANRNKIEVTGYVGITWFGRTETWIRVE